MAEIEWSKVDLKSTDKMVELCKVEAQRKIAEQLNRMNENIETLLKSGVPDKDPD